MIKKFKYGLFGILKGLNPFDMKCSLDYSVERANNFSNREFINIEEKVRDCVKFIIYDPLTYFVCNSIYTILNIKERLK